MNPEKLLFLAAMVCVLVAFPSSGEAWQTQSPDTAKQPQADAETQARYDQFSKMLSGSKFVGNFTMLGKKNDNLTAEEYHIKSVQKMEKGDMWLFTARIKYGERDISVPIPLQVKWAGDTPVITVTDFSFFGIGPFSSRVVIYNGKYAGTWSHGEDAGGHLFGLIENGAAEGVDVEQSRRDMEKKKDDAKAKSDSSSTSGNGDGR